VAKGALEAPPAEEEAPSELERASNADMKKDPDILPWRVEVRPSGLC
jgi:hypothetical protein